MPTAQASLTSWCTRSPRWPSRQRQRALASTDVSGSVPAVSYGDRDLGADAGMKGYHATTQVLSTSPAFALILLTLDAWKRMQMSELQRRAERPAPRRATCPRSASCDMFWGATRIGTPRAATPVGAALRAVPAQGRITLGATRIGTHSAATPPGAALRAVPAQGRFWHAPMHLLCTRSPLEACVWAGIFEVCEALWATAIGQG